MLFFFRWNRHGLRFIQHHEQSRSWYPDSDSDSTPMHATGSHFNVQILPGLCMTVLQQIVPQFMNIMLSVVWKQTWTSSFVMQLITSTDITSITKNERFILVNVHLDQVYWLTNTSISFGRGVTDSTREGYRYYHVLEMHLRMWNKMWHTQGWEHALTELLGIPQQCLAEHACWALYSHANITTLSASNYTVVIRTEDIRVNKRMTLYLDDGDQHSEWRIRPAQVTTLEPTGPEYSSSTYSAVHHCWHAAWLLDAVAVGVAQLLLDQHTDSVSHTVDQLLPVVVSSQKQGQAKQNEKQQ